MTLKSLFCPDGAHEEGRSLGACNLIIGLTLIGIDAVVGGNQTVEIVAGAVLAFGIYD